MATAAVLQFMQKTGEDEALRQQLEALLGVGDGNISSEAELDAIEREALKGERSPVVAEFAAKQGFHFSVDELTAVMEAFAQYQAGKISDADFAALIGTPASKVKGNNVALVTKPLRRLARYMGKTYLGIAIAEK